MDNIVSKTQMKQEATALQKLGLKLAELKNEQLETVPISDTLKSAIQDYNRIKSHGAMRRQAQLIGKLMRAEDVEAISSTYQNLVDENSTQTAAFHEVEQWRERLISEGRDALTQFIAEYQPEDIQALRHAVNKAVAEKNQNRHTGASKALFRLLRILIS